MQQAEQFSHKFEESEVPQIREQAEKEGWKEGLERAINSKLVQLEETIDTTHPPLETRFNTLRSFVASREQTSSTGIEAPEIDEIPETSQAALTQKFQQDLTDGAIDGKNWKGALALTSFEFIQEAEKISANPDAKIGQKLKGILLGILGNIGMSIGAKDMYKNFKISLANIRNGEKPKTVIEDEGNIDNSTENSRMNIIKYTTGINILLGVSKGESPETYSILTARDIKNKSYNELEVESLPGSPELGLGEKNGLPGRDKEVHQAFSILQGKEVYLDKFFANNTDFDWKNQSLEKVIFELYKFGKIFENLDGVSLDDFIKGRFDIFSLFDENNEDSGALNELLESRKNDPGSKLHGVSDVFLISVYQNNHSSFEKDLLLKQDGFQEGADTVFIDDFINFRENLPNFISESFFVGSDGSEDGFQKFFEEYEFGQKEVLQLYILSDGAQDKALLNDMEESLIFLKIFQMMGLSNLRGETYSYAIKEALIGGNTKMIEALPDGLVDILKKYLGAVGGEILENLKGFAGEIWGTLSPGERLAFGGVAVVIGAGMLYLGRIALIGKSALLGMGALGLGQILLKIYQTKKDEPEFKAILDKHNITSEDEFVSEFSDGI